MTFDLWDILLTWPGIRRPASETLDTTGARDQE